MKIEKSSSFGVSYVPQHMTTENYLAGMQALHEGKLDEAVRCLEAEPIDSPCYVLALGNLALAQFRLTRYGDAEQLARKACDRAKEFGCPHAASAVQFARTRADAVAAQGRMVESFDEYSAAIALADELLEKHPDQATEISLEKAYVYDGLGTANLQLERTADAIESFQKSSAIYRRNPRSDDPGLPVTLTNLAQAYRLAGNLVSSDLALREALTASEERGDADQAYKTKLAAIQLGSNLVASDEVWSVIDESVDAALDEKRFNVASVRLCIGASEAFKSNEFDRAADYASRARGVFSRSGQFDLNSPKLWLTEAGIRLALTGEAGPAIDALIRGANEWIGCLASDSFASERRALTLASTRHFQALADLLIQTKRLDEAWVAFESGRALAHALASDIRRVEHLARRNPFPPNGGSIRLGYLDEIRQLLKEDEIAVSLAILGQTIFAFGIARGGVSLTKTPLPADKQERDSLRKDIGALPVRLGAGVGSDAIPGVVFRVAEAIQTLMAGRRIRVLAPHSWLHAVPWRAALRAGGSMWRQLAFSTAFGLLFGASKLRAEVSYTKGIALGFGDANGTNLRDEATAFAKAFGDCEVSERCSRSDVTYALSKAAAILVSCHGQAKSLTESPQLTLYLEDGEHLAEDVFPAPVVAPLVILSACESGTYTVGSDDEPSGAVPLLLQRGARRCIATRFPIRAPFALRMVPLLGAGLSRGESVSDAFVGALCDVEGDSLMWQDLASIELFL